MLQLKLVKGELENQRLTESDNTIIHGTRVTQELVRCWQHIGRVIAADSYCASVPCALALQSLGLQTIGVIKTSTREYLMNYLSNFLLPVKGD